MSEVKRYDCTNGRAQHCYGCYQMTESTGGDFVESTDFDRVTAEREALQQRLNEQDQRVDELEGLLRRCLMSIREQHCDADEAEFDLPNSLLGEIDAALNLTPKPTCGACPAGCIGAKP